jgi:hypothetical protein
MLMPDPSDRDAVEEWLDDTEPLLEERKGDAYFLGDLDAGKWLVDVGDGVTEGWVSDDVYQVEFSGNWGRGPDAATAWRFALGAEFGPIDSEYNEEGLRKALRQFKQQEGLT